MRPIYLPVKKKPDVTFQGNGNVSPEEPEIVSNGLPKEDYRVAVSNLISKFETTSTPSPKKSSLMKSKSFSARGSKKELRTNQTQDDALHNKTEAEVEEIKKLGVRDLRKKFEEIENNTDNGHTTPVHSEIQSEENISPLANIAKLRLEHFKRLTKKWERHVGELLRHLKETSDCDIYNVRIQDLELSINRELHAMKVNPKDIASQEYVTPQQNSPEIEALSLVAKIASLYEIKSKETTEEKPRTPTQTPKRLPWTAGRRERKKEVEKQIEEDEKLQEAVVTEEIKQEEVVVEEPKPEKLKEEPAKLVDTEHLKSASLITSYFNSLSNVNNRNNDTSRFNSTKEKQTPSPKSEDSTFGYLEQSSVLEPVERHQTSEQFNESNKTAQNNSYESINEPEEEHSEQLNESSIQHDTTIDREFEKYYSEDLKPTGSEERLFEDYYRENVLEDSIPEEPDEEEYEEGAKKSFSAVVDEDAAEENSLVHEAKIVEDDDDGYIHQSKIQEASAVESGNIVEQPDEETAEYEEKTRGSYSAMVEGGPAEKDNSVHEAKIVENNDGHVHQCEIQEASVVKNGYAVTKDSFEEPTEKTAEYEDETLNSYSAVIEEDETGEDNLKLKAEDNESKGLLHQQETEEDFQNRVAKNIVIVDDLPQEVQKQEETVVKGLTAEIPKEVESDEAISQCIVEKPIVESILTEESAMHAKQEEVIVGEATIQGSEEVQRNEAFQITENSQENEELTPKNENCKKLETSQIEEESTLESIHKHAEKDPHPKDEHKKAHIVEIAPVMRRHHDQHHPPEKEHPASPPVEGSCLKKYIMDTSDFINHEKTTS